MQFGPPDCPACQADCCNPFQFAPTADAVVPPWAWQLTNRSADLDRLDVSDLADDLEFHHSEFAVKRSGMQARPDPSARRVAGRFSASTDCCRLGYQLSAVSASLKPASRRAFW